MKIRSEIALTALIALCAGSSYGQAQDALEDLVDDILTRTSIQGVKDELADRREDDGGESNRERRNRHDIVIKVGVRPFAGDRPGSRGVAQEIEATSGDVSTNLSPQEASSLYGTFLKSLYERSRQGRRYRLMERERLIELYGEARAFANSDNQFQRLVLEAGAHVTIFCNVFRQRENSCANFSCRSLSNLGGHVIGFGETQIATRPQPLQIEFYMEPGLSYTVQRDGQIVLPNPYGGPPTPFARRVPSNDSQFAWMAQAYNRSVYGVTSDGRVMGWDFYRNTWSQAGYVKSPCQ